MSRHLLSFFFLFVCGTNGFSQKGLYTTQQEWPVKINDGWFTAKTISYGIYTTASRKNGIADATAVNFIKAPLNPFNFKVTGKEVEMLVQMIQATHIAFSGHSLPSFLDNMPATAVFSYALINGTGNQPVKRWEIILKDVTYLELNDDKPAGILRSPDEELRITAHNRFGTRNSYENICYEFHYRRQLVAAVVTGNNPRVWMSAEMDGKALQPILAAAVGALLLR
jgi:hypothetical protein